MKFDCQKASVSDAVKRLNPELFAVGGLRAAERKPGAEETLERGGEGGKEGAGEVAGGGQRYRVAIVVFRRRLIDQDNQVTGAKWLRDAVARWLGVDDSERFVEWEVEQVRTRGRVGTLVRVERI